MKTIIAIFTLFLLSGCIIVSISPRGDGIVIDRDSGEPIPGVEITVTHERLKEKEKQANTDVEGKFTLPVLRLITPIPFSAIQVRALVRFKKDGYEPVEFYIELDEEIGYRSSNIEIIKLTKSK